MSCAVSLKLPVPCLVSLFTCNALTFLAVALMREVHVELEEVKKEEQALQSEPEGSRAFANVSSK